MAEPSTGCFDRFWMAALAVVVAVAVAAGIAVVNPSRVSAQSSDWSAYESGTLYLVTPVRSMDIFDIVEPPRIQDGFLCAVVEQLGEEICVPLTNVAGLTQS